MQGMQQWSGVDSRALCKRLLAASRAERGGDICSAAAAVGRCKAVHSGARTRFMYVLQRVPSRQACRPVRLLQLIDAVLARRCGAMGRSGRTHT